MVQRKGSAAGVTCNEPNTYESRAAVCTSTINATMRELLRLTRTFVRPSFCFQPLLRPAAAISRRNCLAEPAGQGSHSVGFGIQDRAENRAQFFDGGKLGQVLEPKMEQKTPCSPVKDWIPASFSAPSGGNELPAQQGVEGIAIADAADGLHLCRRNRLFVGDDGSGFQSCFGQGRGRRQRPDNLFQFQMMLGFGAQSLASGDRAQHEAMLWAIELRCHFR